MATCHPSRTSLTTPGRVGASLSTPVTPTDPPPTCVVSIITDDDSDVETVKDVSINRATHSRPLMKHIANSASFTVYTELDPNGEGPIGSGGGGGATSHSSQQSLSSRSQAARARQLSGASQSSGLSQTGCAPILLAVPSAGPPRRRHSWICG